MIFRIIPKQIYEHHRQCTSSEDIYDKNSTDYYIVIEKYIVDGYEKPISVRSCIFTSDTSVTQVLSNVSYHILDHGFFIKHIKFGLIEA